ncbi:MAG: hypothetical protein HFH48_09890 [Lachnospiraceae bacterium]|nr:hypothetical protein [Lachnospiraceae bacterium]
MAKIRYSTGLKAAAIVAQQIFSVLLVLFLIILIVLFQKDILDFGNLKDKSFESSGYFSSKFQNVTDEVLAFTDLRRKFETDGSYDSEKEVDIWDYYNNQETASREEKKGKKRNMMRYSLGDLSEWSRAYNKSTYEFVSSYSIDNGIQQKRNIYRDGSVLLSEEKSVSGLAEFTPELQELIVGNVEHFYGGSYSVSMYDDKEQNFVSRQTDSQALQDDLNAVASEAEDKNSAVVSEVKEQEQEVNLRIRGSLNLEEKRQMEEIIPKVIEGRLYDLKEEELILLLRSMDMEYAQSNVEHGFVEEDYLPKGGVGIWDNYMKGKCTMEQMYNSYLALEFTLENIGTEINQYKRCLNRYNLREGGTNVYYWISRGNEDVIYTNITEPLEEQLAEYGRKKGKYVFYRENDIRLETNVKEMEDIFYTKLEPKYGGKGNVLFVCVDTDFPQRDDFFHAKEEYKRMYPWIYLSIIGVILSVSICLISLIYLSMAAGRREGDDRVHLNLFDRVPTEILYLLTVVEGIFCFMMYGAALYRFGSGELTGLLITTGVLTFFSIALFSIFYLSFVRRIRAGVLWSQSILHWMIHGIEMTFASRKSSFKLLVWFGFHLLICFVLLSFMLSNAYNGEALVVGMLCFVVLSGIEGILIIKEGIQRNKVLEGIGKISSGDLEYKVDVEELKGDNKRLAEAVNAIGDGLFHAVDDNMRNEHLKTDLITNVSHDIKTPLTSIINYVDLLKREELPNEKVQNYIAVLDSKSQRLKQLTEDLVEASKVSSGNIKLNMERINLVELIHQTGGEFDEKFEARNLTVVTKLPREPVVIMADGRRIWRVLENIYNNAAKYAMENTRIYVGMEADGEQVEFSIKNISENPLNIQADELTERFIRGDISRSTEGSGLGLSIAKSLTALMGGEFEIYLDGDLFKVTITFKQEPESRSMEIKEEEREIQS